MLSRLADKRLPAATPGIPSGQRGSFFASFVGLPSFVLGERGRLDPLQFRIRARPAALLTVPHVGGCLVLRSGMSQGN